jgi:hypothetical protein
MPETSGDPNTLVSLDVVACELAALETASHDWEMIPLGDAADLTIWLRGTWETACEIFLAILGRGAATDDGGPVRYDFKRLGRRVLAPRCQHQHRTHARWQWRCAHRAMDFRPWWLRPGAGPPAEPAFIVNSPTALSRITIVRSSPPSPPPAAEKPISVAIVSLPEGTAITNAEPKAELNAEPKAEPKAEPRLTDEKSTSKADLSAEKSTAKKNLKGRGVEYWIRYACPGDSWRGLKEKAICQRIKAAAEAEGLSADYYPTSENSIRSTRNRMLKREASVDASASK